MPLFNSASRTKPRTEEEAPQPSGFTTSSIDRPPAASGQDTALRYRDIYAARTDGGFTLPAVPYARLNPQYLRQIVDYPTEEKPDTIVVDRAHHYLYLVQENGTAIRYGIAIGKDGFSWSGKAIVQYKKAWPSWHPPAEMVQRLPELERYGGGRGMGPALDNPLGSRAFYIYQNGQDTLYRVHGTPEWWTIGKNVSSGCIRLFNQDIIDLYDRTPQKTYILVI